MGRPPSPKPSMFPNIIETRPDELRKTRPRSASPGKRNQLCDTGFDSVVVANFWMEQYNMPCPYYNSLEALHVAPGGAGAGNGGTGAFRLPPTGRSSPIAGQVTEKHKRAASLVGSSINVKIPVRPDYINNDGIITSNYDSRNHLDRSIKPFRPRSAINSRTNRLKITLLEPQTPDANDLPSARSVGGVPIIKSWKLRGKTMGVPEFAKSVARNALREGTRKSGPKKKSTKKSRPRSRQEAKSTNNLDDNIKNDEINIIEDLQEKLRQTHLNHGSTPKMDVLDDNSSPEEQVSSTPKEFQTPQASPTKSAVDDGIAKPPTIHRPPNPFGGGGGFAAALQDSAKKLKKTPQRPVVKANNRGLTDSELLEERKKESEYFVAQIEELCSSESKVRIYCAGNNPTDLV